MTDIYSPENIARSRARARGMRQMVLEGKLAENWNAIADEVDAYADEREDECPARRETTTSTLNTPQRSN